MIRISAHRAAILKQLFQVGLDGVRIAGNTVKLFVEPGSVNVHGVGIAEASAGDWTEDMCEEPEAASEYLRSLTETSICLQYFVSVATSEGGGV